MIFSVASTSANCHCMLRHRVLLPYMPQQRRACGDEFEQRQACPSRLLFLCSVLAQVHRARIEARAEGEASAEERFAAALAHERAELDKQARSLLSAYGTWLPCPRLRVQSVCAVGSE